jgi:hypothetical protein
MFLRTSLKVMITSICIFSATKLALAEDIYQEPLQKASSNPEILGKVDGKIEGRLESEIVNLAEISEDVTILQPQPELLAEAEKSSPTVQEPKAEASMPETASSQSTHPDLEVTEFVLTTKVEGREPTAIVENFGKENGMAYAFARIHVKNHAQVTFVWFRDGKEQSRFTTNVHVAKRWRTYASTKLRPGTWKVQLLSNNEVLIERPFMVD